MNIFNSLGSNYDLSFVINSLFAKAGDTKVLENFLTEKYGKKVVLLYKGREAIELALKWANIPNGSYVAINGYTCFALYEAVKNVGLNVEYLDIEKGELNFSAAELGRAVEKNKEIKAVIIQNTLGYPCDVAAIQKVCQKNGLILIEDLAHSIGARYANNKEAGTLGDFVILSFSQDKVIDGISGGALFSNQLRQVEFTSVPKSRQVKDRFYPLFTYLIRLTYPFIIGKIIHFILKNLNALSGPMDKTNGISLLPGWYLSLIKMQFGKLDDYLNHRKIIALTYAKNINPKILSPKIFNTIADSTNLRFPIFVENRSSLIKFLAENRIFVSDIWYDAPIAPKRYLSQTNYSHQCPNAELASDEILNLPTHINVSVKEAEKIAQLINQWLISK